MYKTEIFDSYHPRTITRCSFDNDWWICPATDEEAKFIVHPKSENCPDEDNHAGECPICKYSTLCYKMTKKCKNCDYQFTCVIYL